MESNLPLPWKFFVLFKEVLVIQVYKNIKLTRNKNRIQKAFSISQIWYKTV